MTPAPEGGKMVLRGVLISVLLAVLSGPNLCADETSDKLDSILNEIRELKERVGRLEATVRLLERSVGESNNAAAPAKRPARTPQYRLRETPAEIIRLQTTTPGVLLKGIHERERELRKRFFPADVMPLPPSLPQR